MSSNQEKCGFDPPPPSYDQSTGAPPPVAYPGAPPQGGYPGVQQQAEYPGVHQQAAYPGAPPQGVYPGAPPQGGYAGAPQQATYLGAPPQGGYAGTPQQATYPGGPPTGAYLGTPGARPATPTVIIQAAPTVNVGKDPVTMDCPGCKMHISTKTESTPGAIAWIIFGTLCFLGFFFLFPWCCVCIPFCSSSMQDTVHTCPNCNSFIGKHKAVFSGL